ncbi:MAG: Gfo/Idh/MocA family oxidoreductase [Verrucomicrobiaceae bacterium]|nr:MAG: Gfo/Idh/MocA family oxidoreductase [Verrucomicrobiaceae bacterium]
MTASVAVGIVGYGYWGPNLARNFGGLTGARLTAVCDLDPARLARMRALHPGVSAYGDFEKMLRKSDLDAVAIATPVGSHHAIAKACLRAGKHVLVEKPMAGSVAECEELIAVAGDEGLTLMVGHTYLYSEAVAKIREIIASGDIGDIRYINCQRLNLGLFQQDINVAWDLAPHDLSIILHIMGESPHTVNCQGNAHINPDVEDVTNISLSFRGRRFATIQSSWLEPRKVRQMTFVGTRKMIVFDDLQPLEKIRIYDVRVDCPPHYDSFAEFQYSYHYGDCYIPHIGQREPLAAMCGDFIGSILGHRQPVSCGTNGLEVVRILQAGQQSLRAGGAPVELTDPKIVPLSAGREPLAGAV